VTRHGGWLSREYEQRVVQPIEAFANPRQEWRRLFSELLGTLRPAGVGPGANPPRRDELQQ